ncbi:MAG: hypothetical protein ABIU97_05250 [Dehalococcoidia bacterium]
MSEKLRAEIIDIPFDSERHKQVITALMQRVKMSRDKFSTVFSRYALDEEAYRAYVKATDNDRIREEVRKHGKPQFTTIYVPYTLSILWALHTYWSSVFLGRNPVWQIAARHAEPHKNVLAIEAMLDYQTYSGKHMVPYYIWLMDAGKYGRGILGTYWADEYTTTTKIEEKDVSFLGYNVSKKKVKATYKVPGYKGNKVYNVRPQDWLPDPRVPTHRFQDGEFCGRVVEVGWNTILKRRSEGKYYNVTELRGQMRGASGGDRDTGSSTLLLPDQMDTLYNTVDSNNKKNSGFAELIEITVELVPKDWGLGVSTAPEKYIFTIGNNSVIVSCQPFGELHDQYPFSTIEFEIEGYSLNKRSVFEIGEPLNNTLSWLFNSHMHNVRKTMNDMLFVDPSRFVMKDLTDPGAGKLVRAKPEYYGQDVSAGVHQLQIVDITRAHMQDAQTVAEMLMRTLGANDAIMGMLSPGGRKTATEVRTSSTAGVNRQKTTCEWFSAMGFQPLADMMISSTQQHYDAEMQFKIAGDLLNNMQPMVVTPDMIAGKFNFVAVDGTLPIDRFAMAQVWKELLIGAKNFPEIGMQYDLASIFGWIAQMSGIKNLEQFRIQSVDPAAISQMVQSGNIVPLGGQQGGKPPGGRAPNGPAPGSTRDLTQVPQTGSVGGVGRAG